MSMRALAPSPDPPLGSLADYVAGDLGRRLARRGTLPFPLTLNGIAAHYGVSTTPVRGAVRALVARGVLRRTAGGRLEPGGVPGGDAFATVEPNPPPSLVDSERRLTELVVTASLAGDLAYLREDATASRLGIGRAVLRRLLARLAGAGLVEHVPRCGWRPRAYRAADMNHYLEVRVALEGLALEQAFGRLDRAHLQEIRAGNTLDPGGRPQRLDNRLHDHWIERSGNRFIEDFFRSQGPFFQALFDVATVDRRAVEAMAAQHCRILDAVLAGDLATSRRELAEHIRAQRPLLESCIAAWRSGGAAGRRRLHDISHHRQENHP